MQKHVQDKVKMMTNHDATQLPVIPPFPPSIEILTANNVTGNHFIESPTPHDDTVLARPLGTVAAVNTAARYNSDLDANTSFRSNITVVDFGANISVGTALPLDRPAQKTLYSKIS